MTSPSPKISIISINFNQAMVTAEMLKSLRKVSYPEIEIIIVDNGSDEDSGFLKQDFPEIIYVRSDQNLGFAGGNNLGFKSSTGQYILLLNNDTEVTEGFLEPMVETFNKQETCGIVSPKIIFYNSNNTIQYAGTSPIQPLTCRGFTRGYGETDIGQYNVCKETSLCHGAAMLINRQLYEFLGGLSEAYFLYYEEYDFCEQVKKAGYSIYYNGLSQVYHKESVSVGKLSPLKAYYMARNRIVFAKRNFNGFNQFTSILYYTFIAFPKHLLTEMLHNRLRNCMAMIKGALAGFAYKF